jgi:DNA-binding CsgD family transcriptional regulator
MTKSRGNATSKAHRAERQAREIELMNAGKTQTEIAEELGISRQTFWRDIQKLTADYAAGNQPAFAQLREVQVGALLDLAREVHDDAITPEVGNSVRGFLDSVSRILGLNAPVKSVSVRVDDPAKMGMYRRFIHETMFVPEPAFEEIWALCHKLSQPPTAASTALIGPPLDSPLWHDGDEEEETPLLTEGENPDALD